MHEDSLAARLSPLLDPLEGQIKSLHYRVVPSTFDSADSALRAFPLARQWQWQSAAEQMARFKPQTLILQLPSFWQVEPFVHAAARAARVPICIIEPQNFPLDKAAIRLASADAVLAEGREAASIAEYLHKEGVALPPYWMIVFGADTSDWSVPLHLRSPRTQVATEVHLVPGVPLLVQCKHCVDAQLGHYHQSELFTWGPDLAAPSISSKESLLVPFDGFKLPFALASKGICACGKPLFARAS